MDVTIETLGLGHLSDGALPAGTAWDDGGKKRLRVGLVLPYKSFGVRDYTKALTTAIAGVQRSTSRGRNLVLSRGFDLQGRISMMPLTPSPKGESSAAAHPSRGPGSGGKTERSSCLSLSFSLVLGSLGTKCCALRP